jgi:Domain of unknown function (DUF4124)
MRRVPILLLLVACATAYSATVYKWVDANGVTHFSDQPHPGAEKLEISGAQTYDSQAAAVAAPPSNGVPRPAAAAATTTCVIDSPGSGQILVDTYSLNGHLSLGRPADGDQAMLRLDGQDISALVGPDGGFTVSQIDRGDHTLTLQVNNARGDVTCQANAVTFTIRQRSVIPPTAPTAPTAPGVARGNY